jgi:hypothetical protein
MSRPGSAPSVALAALCAALALSVLSVHPGPAFAATGTLIGRVLDGKAAGGYANVVVLGSMRGATALEDGTFRITLVPVGRWTLRVELTGREPRLVTVDVNAGENRLAPIALGAEKIATTTEVVKVTAKRGIDLTSSGSRQEFTGRHMDELHVDNVMEMIALRAGIVAQAGQLHIRGGRGDEFGLMFDGMGVLDPLTRQAPTIANLAVATTDVQTGGITAEYGGSISGFANVTTREGGDKFGGDVQWHTDRYGESGKTFDDYDRVAVGLGGPLPVKGLTYFATYEGTFSDTYLDAGRTQPERSVFDFLRLGNRQSNQLNTNLKFAYTPPSNAGEHLTFESIQNRSITTPYDLMWSRKGYVSVTKDDKGNDVYGAWSFFPEDSTYRYENLADHVPTTDARFGQFKAVWRQALSSRDVYTVRVSQVNYRSVTSVQGKAPWEYAVQSPQYWSGNLANSPFFATHGDYPLYSQRNTTTWTAKADFTTQHWKGHTAKVGVEGVYNTVRLLAMQNPNQEAGGLPGLNRSDFTNYNPEGSAYAQDQWGYEGLVLNAGMRMDLFSPGDQIAAVDLPHGRTKGQLSPRLGIAYPISDRDVLSFHYGWTFQTPARNFVFENRGSQSNVTVRGNPDLEPETDISYQAAMQHKFSQDVSGQFAVFFRDIFGLISVRSQVNAETGLLVPVYQNQDYASARGFEASLQKTFSHRFSGELAYTYAIATGVASDPNSGLQFAQGRSLYLPIAEQSLNWDQRNTVNANLIVRDPGRWGVTFEWAYGSGLPFTPAFRNDRKPDPKFRNTRRLPSNSSLSIVADRYARLWGRNVTFFLDARNVLDSTPIVNLTPNNTNGENPFIDTVGSDYLVYYTETGRAGGAYLRDDNGDHVEDWNPVNDPRVFAEGRNIRVGVGVSF